MPLLDNGISTFDTADVYANTVAEQVLGDALKGQRRESLEIFTKVYFPTGPKGHNDTGLSRKHMMESINGSLSRLGTDYVDLYQAHRYDYETPLEETMQAFADIVRAGKALYIGVSEWNADQLRAAHQLARDLGIQLVSNQPQYNMLWRVIEPKVIPTSKELGISQVVWSPIAQGVLTGKYKVGQPAPAGSRATDENGGKETITDRYLNDETLNAVAKLEPIAADLESDHGAARHRLGACRTTMWPPHLSVHHVPSRSKSNVAASGVKLDAEVLARIDEALGDLPETNPSKTKSPATRLV